MQKSRVGFQLWLLVFVGQEDLLQVVSPVNKGFYLLVLVPMDNCVCKVTLGPSFEANFLWLLDMEWSPDYESHHVLGSNVWDSYAVE